MSDALEQIPPQHRPKFAAALEALAHAIPGESFTLLIAEPDGSMHYVGTMSGDTLAAGLRAIAAQPGGKVTRLALPGRDFRVT